MSIAEKHTRTIMTDQESSVSTSDISIISLPTRPASEISTTSEQHSPAENMATPTKKTVKVATIQAEPAWNDLEGGVNKAIALIKEAASNGANVLGFPEVFIPGYPWYVES